MYYMTQNVKKKCWQLVQAVQGGTKSEACGQPGTFRLLQASHVICHVSVTWIWQERHVTRSLREDVEWLVIKWFSREQVVWLAVAPSYASVVKCLGSNCLGGPVSRRAMCGCDVHLLLSLFTFTSYLFTLTSLSRPLLHYTVHYTSAHLLCCTIHQHKRRSAHTNAMHCMELLSHIFHDSSLPARNIKRLA